MNTSCSKKEQVDLSKLSEMELQLFGESQSIASQPCSSKSIRAVSQGSSGYAEGDDDIVNKAGGMATPPSGGFPGFATAGGRKVTVSEKAVAQAMALFENVLDTPGSTTEAKRQHTTFTSTPKSFKRAEGDDGIVNKAGGMATPPSGGFPGFATAGGRKVTVSEKAVAQAMALFENVLDTPGSTTEAKRPHTTFASTPKSSKSSEGDDDIVNKADGMAILPSGGFPGFATAGGRKVTVSETAVAQAMALFENVLDTPGSTTEAKRPYTTFTSTPKSSKRVEDDDDIVNKAGGMATPQSGGFPGFATAGGRKVTVSEKAVAQAMALFENVLDTPGPTTEAKRPHATFTSTPKSSKRAEGDHDIINKAGGMATPPSGGFPGFATAGGKKVTVSETAIAQAMALFENVLDTPGSTTEAKRQHTTFTSTPKSFMRAEGDDGIVNKAGGMATPPSGGFPGFATAGGRKVTVSETAVAQAMALFENVLDTPGSTTEAKRQHTTFTSTPKSSKRSEGDDDIVNKADGMATPPSGGFPGFATAGGRKVTVSETAVAQAMALFENVLDTPDSTTEAQRLYTTFTSTPKSSNRAAVIVTEPKLSSSPSIHSSDDEVSREVEESTRLLLEDAESDDESDWTTNEQPTTLNNIESNGQIVPLLKLAVVRKYPVVYCVDVDLRGRKEYLSEEAFRQWRKNADLKTEKVREAMLPEIEEKVRQSLNKNAWKTLKGRMDSPTGQEILRCVVFNEEPPDICYDLSPRTLKQLNDERADFEERVRVAVQEELTTRMKTEAPEKRSNRMLKVRVVDLDSYTFDDLKAPTGMITFWNPTEDVVDGIEEGHVYEFSNIKTHTFQLLEEIKLSSTKETRILPVLTPGIENSMTRKLTTIQMVLSGSFRPAFAEFDVVGVVAKVDTDLDKDHQYIYLSDQWRNTLKVKFWNNLKETGLEEVLKPGNVVACCNFQWRMSSSSTGTAYVQDVSTFIINPKANYLRDGYNDFRSAIEGLENLVMGEKEPNLNVSRPGIPHTLSVPRRRISMSSKLFRYSKKRPHSDHEDSPNDSSELSSDQSTPVPKRNRLSRKFVPPRRLSPSPKT